MRTFTNDIELKMKACHESFGAANKLGYESKTIAMT